VASRDFDGSALLSVIEKGCGMAREVFCGSGKTADHGATVIVGGGDSVAAELIRAREMLILIGRQAGASVKTCQNWWASAVRQ
jgi:hypothetical protein